MNAKNLSIGGEFELNPTVFNNPPQVKYLYKFFSSGRDALRAILRVARKAGHSEIYIPCYICQSVKNVIQSEGFEIHEYKLTFNLHIDASQALFMHRQQSLILVVDYFGLLDLTDDIKNLHEHGATVILDKVQALFQEETFDADYWFSGFRKFLPTYEGAFAYSKEGEIDPPKEQCSWSLLKALGGLVKYSSSYSDLVDESYLRLFEIADKQLDDLFESNCASQLICYTLKALDIPSIRRKRQQNYLILSELLKERGMMQFVFSEVSDPAPLSLPIAIENRDKVRAQLMQQKIYLPIHWVSESQSRLSSFASRCELSLIIDQRYRKEEMVSLVNALCEVKATTIVYDCKSLE